MRFSLAVFYPGSAPEDAPALYLRSVEPVEDDAAVLDCLLLNPLLAVRAVHANRHYLARV